MKIESRLWAVAQAARSFLVPIWSEWHEAWGDLPDIPSRWTCGRSSLFLQHVLLRDCDGAAEWVSGAPRRGPEEPEIAPFGFFTGQGWESHAWVEVEKTWVVDITADQFQDDEIIVTKIEDARYAKGHADTALPELREAPKVAVKRLWPVWRNSADRLSIPWLSAKCGPDFPECGAR